MGDASLLIASRDIEAAGQALLSLCELADAKLRDGGTTSSKLTVEAKDHRSSVVYEVTRRV